MLLQRFDKLAIFACLSRGNHTGLASLAAHPQRCKTEKVCSVQAVEVGAQPQQQKGEELCASLSPGGHAPGLLLLWLLLLSSLALLLARVRCDVF